MKNRESKRKNTKKIILIASLLIFAFLLAAAFMLALQVPEVTFASSLRFPIGAELTVSDIVEEVRYGSLTDPDKALDSSKKGLIKFTFTLKNLFKIKSEKEIMIDFYDPTETESKDEKETEEDSTTFFPTPYDQNENLIDGVYSTKTGKILEIKNGVATIDGYLIVNKSFPLPKNYDPGDLTDETKAACNRLLEAAENDGITIPIDNGFRSWRIQHNLFNGYVKSDSLENALTYSARAGHSEHQSGLAIDFLLSNSEEAKLPENKVILDWLNENAYRYGFILRYPDGKTNITGYIYEPWHYRYVGTELADLLYNGGDWITMEEYFGIDSVYRGY